MDEHTRRLAKRHLVRHTHDGVVLDLPRQPPSPLMVLFVTCGWLLVGVLSLVFIAQPVAAFVEYMGWWLVNEKVLQFRWMAIGLPLWPVLAIPIALLVRGRDHVRVQLDQHGIRWSRRLGSRRVPWSAVRGISVRGNRLGVATSAGRTYWMPQLKVLPGFSLTQPNPLRELASAVESWQLGRFHGSPEEVPEELRAMIEQRP